MKKLMILSIFILFIGMPLVLTQTSAEIFYIDDKFKVGWTDGTDNYEAEYKVWKIEETSDGNITILTHASTGSIAIHSLNGLEHPLGASAKLIINQIYVSGDDKWISITLENVEYKESTSPPPSGSGGSGGGGGAIVTCSDSDGGKDYFEKGETIRGAESSAGAKIDRCDYKGEFLTEYYCGEDKSILSTIYSCPGKCEDGACVEGDDEGDSCTQWYTCPDGSKVKKCEIASNGMCGCRSHPEDLCEEEETPTTTYFKNCNYIWDSSPYIGQTIKITASIKDSSGSMDSDSVNVDVVGSVLKGGGGAYPMDGKILDIQIIEPGSGEVAGAVEIKINSKGPVELGEMSLGLSGDRWGAGFPISNKNCIAGGSGGRSSGGGSTCEKYHICEDSSEVQYCEIIKQYDDEGDVVGAGCACKQNPEELCTPLSSGGREGGGQPTEIPSSGGKGSGGNNETLIICSGCVLGDKCAPVGYRIEEKYCNLDSEFVNYLNSGETCNNNFECKSNLCIDDECISGGLFRKILNWFRKMFGGE